MKIDYGDSAAAATAESLTAFSSPTQAPAKAAVVSSCAACKILRRRCAETCVLAPYFPPSDPVKFAVAHRVFGASNIIKLLQELPESQREDAVSSMVYEANARLRDPVYGCAGSICQLQNQVNELQAQLAQAQAGLVNMQVQQANLLALLCMEVGPMGHAPSPSSSPESNVATKFPSINNELQAQAGLVNMQVQQANLLAHLCMEVGPMGHAPSPSSSQESNVATKFPSMMEPPWFIDDGNLALMWEPLWT
ncbi:hypothetical protein V2J09_000075 [Rumex salicifolius]